MGRKTIANQIHSALADRIAFSESKHRDKIEQEVKFGESTYKIYSFSTYDTYAKGGRDRLAPILPEKVEQVKAIFEKAKEIGAQRIFEYIPKEIDIHSLRRKYAKDLYHTLTDDKSLRDTYLNYYPPRAEKVKSDFYKDRQDNVFERDTVYVVSQALVHNRIDTSITSYLK